MGTWLLGSRPGRFGYQRVPWKITNDKNTFTTDNQKIEYRSINKRRTLPWSCMSLTISRKTPVCRSSTEVMFDIRSRVNANVGRLMVSPSLYNWPSSFTNNALNKMRQKWKRNEKNRQVLQDMHKMRLEIENAQDISDWSVAYKGGSISCRHTKREKNWYQCKYIYIYIFFFLMSQGNVLKCKIEHMYRTEGKIRT